MSAIDIAYEPNPVPETEGLTQFLYDELYRISAAIPRKTISILYGSTAAFTLGTTAVTLGTYSSGSENANQTTGTITVPQDGVYRVTAWVSGTMSSPTQNNQYALLLLINGTTQVLVAVNDVAHNSTNRIALSAAVTRYATAGDTIQLQMVATASMGTCTFTNTTFELESL